MQTALRPAKLTDILARFPLPPGWSDPEYFVDQVLIGDAQLELAGLSSKAVNGGDVTGSAACRDGDPIERAYFELVERMALIDELARPTSRYPVFTAAGEPAGHRARRTVFPEAPSTASWGYARSNGVALGCTWQSACEAALCELTERDRVLLAWYGETAPAPAPATSSQQLAGLDGLYRFEHRVFPAGRWSRGSADIRVAGVLAFPRERSIAFACGLGAAASVESALWKAERECLQVLAFLWGEELPSSPPLLSSTASYHQDLYLLPEMHELLERWLQGEHRLQGSVVVPQRCRQAEPVFADLTPSCLRGRLYVVRAIADNELRLTFGLGHPRVKPRLARTFAAHPIC